MKKPSDIRRTVVESLPAKVFFSAAYIRSHPELEFTVNIPIKIESTMKTLIEEEKLDPEKVTVADLVNHLSCHTNYSNKWVYIYTIPNCGKLTLRSIYKYFKFFGLEEKIFEGYKSKS